MNEVSRSPYEWYRTHPEIPDYDPIERQIYPESPILSDVYNLWQADCWNLYYQCEITPQLMLLVSLM